MQGSLSYTDAQASEVRPTASIEGVTLTSTFREVWGRTRSLFRVLKLLSTRCGNFRGSAFKHDVLINRQVP